MASSGGTPGQEAWFREACAGRGLALDTDPRLGLVGWWDGSAGSRDHVVAEGGGQRGVAAVLDALDRLGERGWSPSRPVAVVAPGRAAGDDEVILQLVRRPRGLALGPVGQLGARGLFRLQITGQPAPAGPAGEGRRDPMLTYAMTVLAADKQARLCGAWATFGRVEVEPNSPGVVASRVTGWLDVRAGSVEVVLSLAAAVERLGLDRSVRDGTGLSLSAEHVTAQVGTGDVEEALALLAGPADRLDR